MDLSNEMQLWVVQPDAERFPDSNVKTIVWALGREGAKRKAKEGWLRGMGDPALFICTPITKPGDRVKLDITLNV